MLLGPSQSVLAEHHTVEQRCNDEAVLLGGNGVGDPQHLTSDVDVPSPPDFASGEEEPRQSNDCENK